MAYFQSPIDPVQAEVRGRGEEAPRPRGRRLPVRVALQGGGAELPATRVLRV